MSTQLLITMLYAFKLPCLGTKLLTYETFGDTLKPYPSPNNGEKKKLD